MTRATLTVDLDAIAANWRALDALSGGHVETSATIKAGAYGLGVAPVARALAAAGARNFFVAIAEEGAALRDALGEGPQIAVYSGHMAGDADLISGKRLIPMLNSLDQLTRHVEALPGHPFGIQLDTGMNRLGMEPAEWAAVAEIALMAGPALVMSHLACADEPDNPMNGQQLALFRELTDGIDVPRSIAATGGVLLGPAYHFDITRPGIGLYGGAPFTEARPAVRLSLPVIQTREVAAGEGVGYSRTWVAPAPTRIATVAAGYADGILRSLSNAIALYAGDTACPLRGRVSMDLLTVDIGHLARVPDSLDLICPAQGIDALADAAGTIGYEILTSLGPRYGRHYTGTGAPR